MSPKRHELFYWGLVTFQVEDTLYRVPKQHFMAGSPFFRDLFQLPQPDGTVEGDDDEHPIHLPGGITTDEFEVLIKAVCSSRLDEDFQEFTKDDWMCCLKLATMWDFKSLRKLSIDRLGKDFPFASDADRVALGLKYQIPDWVSNGVAALVKRDKLVFTQEEKILLGLETVLHIIEIRESLLESYQQQWSQEQVICPGCGYTGDLVRGTGIGEWTVGVSCNSCSTNFHMGDTDESSLAIDEGIAKRFAMADSPLN